jgi:hypothetical protein
MVSILFLTLRYPSAKCPRSALHIPRAKPPHGIKYTVPGSPRVPSPGPGGG